MIFLVPKKDFIPGSQKRINKYDAGWLRSVTVVSTELASHEFQDLTSSLKKPKNARKRSLDFTGITGIIFKWRHNAGYCVHFNLNNWI